MRRGIAACAQSVHAPGETATTMPPHWSISVTPNGSTITAHVDTAVAMAKRYHGHYLQEATRVRDNLEFSYRHGGTTLLDYLDALRDYRQINLDALNANTQVWLAIHQLSFAAATEIVP